MEGESGNDVLPLVEEVLTVQRQQVVDARIRVRVVTETEHRQVATDLVTQTLSIERLSMNRELQPGEASPVPYEEEDGAVLVVPVLEEVLVVEKRLVVREELRIRRRQQTERVEQPVTLRRQHAVVERLPINLEDDSNTPRKDPLK